MKNTRLETLYRRKLVDAQSASRILPLDHIFKHEPEYFPQKPIPENLDILEIGPGRGDFLFHIAKEWPDKKMMAIEYGIPRFKRLKERLQKNQLSNITLVQADARIPVAKDLANAKLEKIYVLFPDPWPRNKHRQRRLLNKEFTLKLCELLKSDGTFTLATDVKDYADWVRSHFEGTTGLIDLSPNDGESAPSELVPTFFEQKWRALGRSFHYVRVQKV